MLRPTLVLPFAAAAALAVFSPSVSAQKMSPGDFQVESTVSGAEGAKPPKDNAKTGPRAEVRLPATDGGPDLVLVVTGVNRGDSRGGPFHDQVSLGYGEVSLRLGEQAREKTVKDCEYKVDFSYNFAIILRFQKGAAEAVETQVQHISGTIQGTISRSKTGHFRHTLINKRIVPKTRSLVFEVGSKPLAELTTFESAASKDGEPLRYSLEDNRAILGAVIKIRKDGR